MMSWTFPTFWEVQAVPISFCINLSPWEMSIIFNLGPWQRGITGLNVPGELNITQTMQILTALKAEKSNSSLSAQNLVLDADSQHSF